MNILHKIKIDLSRREQPARIDVVQGDSMSRSLEIKLYNNGVAYQVPESFTILQIAYCKPDKTCGLYDELPSGEVACTVAGNTVTAILHPQMFTAAGTVYCELRMIENADKRLTTFKWIMNISESVVNKMNSEDYYNFRAVSILSINDRTPNSQGEIYIAGEDIPAFPANIPNFEGSVDDALDRLATEVFSPDLYGWRSALRNYSDEDGVIGLPILDTADKKYGKMAIIGLDDEMNGDRNFVAVPTVKTVQKLLEDFGRDLGTGGLDFDGGFVDTKGYMHLTLGGAEIPGFVPFYIGSASEAAGDLILEGDRLYLSKDGVPMGEGVTLPAGGGTGSGYLDVTKEFEAALAAGEVSSAKEYLWTLGVGRWSLAVRDDIGNDLERFYLHAFFGEVSNGKGLIYRILIRAQDFFDIELHNADNYDSVPAIKVDGETGQIFCQGAPLGSGGNSTPGKDGGYYVPTVEQVSETEAEVSFVPSDSNMPVIPKVSLKLPVGPPGDPGNTPVVSVSPITGGHRITITNASGTKTVDVMDGVDGDPGKNGGFYVPNVEQVATDTIRMSFTATGNENMPVQQPVVLKLPQGPRGDSYILTDADKSEITRLVIESLGGNPVFGYVDKNNNIILSGNLADGTYTAKYEMEDGSLLPIGDLEIDNTVKYSVVCQLTNCTNTNGAVEVAQGASYTATITPNGGYALESLSVTMGGTDITSSAVSGGNISIAEITGDIVITAVAEEAVVEIVNLIPTSVDTDGTIYNGIGYKTNTRIRGTGATDAYNGASCTGFIKANTGDMVYIKGIANNTAGLSKVHCYDASKTSINAIGFSDLTNEGNGVYSCTINLENTEYIRVASAHIMDGSEIVTVNQPIA